MEKFRRFLGVIAVFAGLLFATNLSFAADIVYPFTATTTSTSTFSFDISAAGTFYVDCGANATDTNPQTITNTTGNTTTITCNWSDSVSHTVKIGGMATGYNTSSAILFEKNTSLKGISGSLGAIFPTIVSSTKTQQPVFKDLFSGCKNLVGTIPSDLFAGVSGAPVKNMFSNAFKDCSSLTGPIPSGLFAGISGAPAMYMFSSTFNGCKNLTGSIPSDLFGTFTGSPASYMFSSTFNNCSSLTGSIPAGLFGNISGAPAYNMYYSTFAGCSKLTGKIPVGLFGTIDTATDTTNMFSKVFNGCSGLTGPAAINGGSDNRFLHDIWPEEKMGTDAYTNTNIDGLAYIPTTWGGAGETCPVDTYLNETQTACIACLAGSTTQGVTGATSADQCVFDDYRFAVTTTSGTESFSFTISAAGTFYVDCGDDATGTNPQTITKTNTNAQTITCKWSNSGTHTVRIGGLATGYPPATTATISFASNTYLKGISGSLGAIFPTTNNDTPSFVETFSNCSNLTGSIPADLFKGISGQPNPHMFKRTFFKCAGLTGNIPAGLFSGISGNPTVDLYNNTFNGCTGLTGPIPAGLFGDISGNPASYMYSGTFAGCTGLTGSIPAGLFGTIKGTPAEYMYNSVFRDCSGLTGEIPAGLFGNLNYPTSSENMFKQMFSGCSGLTGLAARDSSGRFLHDLWPNTTNAPNAYTGTNIEGLAYIPTTWGGKGQTIPAFTVTTTDTTKSFALKISAAGKFYVDCGADAPNRIIVINNETPVATTATCQWPNAATHTIKIAGVATGYSTDTNIAAISFANNTNLAGIKGSLGAVFHTIDDGKDNGEQPRFFDSFNGCTNLTTIPADLFSGIKGAPATSMFRGTFYNCRSLANIPAGLFADITGAPAERMFDSTFSGCKNLSGSIPGNLFAGISGVPASHMFYGTFYKCSNLTSIPAGLFAGISGAPANDMFRSTFNGCSGLTGEIPADLFGQIEGAPTDYMFSAVFAGCTGLTGEIPAGMFGNLSGAPATDMFTEIFNGCYGLTGPAARNGDGQFLHEIWPASGYGYNAYSGANGITGHKYIPTTWGGDGQRPTVFTAKTIASTTIFSFDFAAQNALFVDCGTDSNEGLRTILNPDTESMTVTCTWDRAGVHTIGLDGILTNYDPIESVISFRDNNQLAAISGSLGTVFSTIDNGDGTLTQPIFRETFANCINLSSSIPSGLFTNVYGQPVSSMFASTFDGCTLLSGPIPGGLFEGIYGYPMSSMFSKTFNGCFNLIGQIPSGLFAGIKGIPANYMYAGTFAGCSNLTGAIPENLFGTLSGAPAERMFDNTFKDCTNLSGPIPNALFGSLTSKPAAHMFNATFSGCTNLSGLAARNGGADTRFLHDIWPDAGYGTNAYAGAEKIYAWAYIPTTWGGNGGTPDTFSFTTTKSTIETNFTINAAGLFYIDCGEGQEIQIIDKKSVGNQTITCKWPAAGEHTVAISGRATEYSSDTEIAAISFAENKNITGIYGSLGQMFPTLDNNAVPQPKFMGTFSNCSNIVSEIPENLFDGIYGQPIEHMFHSTFDGCSGLTGEIPAGLFSGISGTPVSSVFSKTFSGCSGLTSIPADLFAGIKGAPANAMFSRTFSECSGLTSIPANLFAGIKGAPADYMFAYTFSGCTGLTGDIPMGLFGNLSGAGAANMFNSVFYNCSGLTGSAARNGDTAQWFLHDIWPDAGFGTDAYAGATNITDWSAIPTTWGGAGDIYYPFSVTTTSDTSTFGFKITAAGKFYVDCGDSVAVQTFSLPTVTAQTVTCKWSKAGTHTVKIGGRATAYSDNETTSVLTFSNKANLYGISGRLGHVFPTLDNGTLSQPRFYGLFSHCSNLSGSIPEHLFNGVYGQPVSNMFHTVFLGCHNLSGSIPAGLFNGISGTPAKSMFSSTFEGCRNISGLIPANLFGGISGTPADSMFSYTFSYCSNLSGSIPSGLFAGISGAPAHYMFGGTFSNCAKLTEIPTDLFGNLSGAPANDMFIYTFSNCSSLTGPAARNGDGRFLHEIWPESGVGANAYSGATNIEGHKYIPTTWGGLGQTPNTFTATVKADTTEFAFTITAAGTYYVGCGANSVQGIQTIIKDTTEPTTVTCNWTNAGEHTVGIDGTATGYTTDSVAAISFQDNTSLVKITGSLGKIFPTISNEDNSIAQPKFINTFSGCNELTGSIPSGLFSNLTGKPTANMFNGTFKDCVKLSGSIPSGLFSNISGTPADNVFASTFENCATLSGSIPGGLFAKISGVPAKSMFANTFAGCTNLTGEIPANLFGEFSGAGASNMFAGTFMNCSGLTGFAAQNGNGKFLHNIWSAAGYGTDAYTGTKIDGLSYIPTTWGGLGETPNTFNIITVSDSIMFDFDITASGRFYIDCGTDSNEGIIMINNNAVTTANIQCTWNEPAEHVIGISGRATGYDSAWNNCYSSTCDSAKPAISFKRKPDLAAISGSLGAIFPTVNNGNGNILQPRFYKTFAACSNLTGSIPATLFEGISGQPASYMFYQTFYGVPKIIDSIPSGLFAGIKGTPVQYMFYQTFYGCTGLTDAIPENLFVSINGAAAEGMFSGTFMKCTGLTEIPEKLFGNLNGSAVENMFSNLFNGCSGLTSYAARNGDGRFLHDVWPNTTYTASAYSGATGIIGWNYIPTTWGGAGQTCAAGTYFNDTKTECLACTENHYCLGGTKAPTACPSGFITDGTGAASKDNCKELFWTITLAANNGTDATSEKVSTWTKGITLSGVSFDYTGYTFADEWCTSDNVCFAEGQTIPYSAFASDTTLYAQWRPNTYYVEFNSNGGNGEMSNQAFTYDMEENLSMNTFGRPGYNFAGWKDANGTEYSDGDSVMNLASDSGLAYELYAQWSECESGYFCPGDNISYSCAVETNHSHSLSGIGSDDVMDCYTECPDYEIEYGTMRSVDYTVYYNTTCEYVGTSVTGNPCREVNKNGTPTCVETSCSSTYEMVNGVCQECNRTGATAYDPNGNCQVIKCIAGMRPDGDKCVPGSEECKITNALVAEMVWDETSGDYGKCIVKECVSGYHIASNQCVSDTRTCDLENGAGIQEWNYDTNAWGECIVTSCEPGYTNDRFESDTPNKPCGRCRNAYDKEGNIAVSTYVRECEIGACMYQGELYALENNECVQICPFETTSDETGSMVWNPRTQKCERKCNEGYSQW